MAVCPKCGTELSDGNWTGWETGENGGHVHSLERCLAAQLAKVKTENVELKNEMYQAGWYHCVHCNRPALENARCPRCGT
jgi:uncharacterized paraquat-inducible protein A